MIGIYNYTVLFTLFGLITGVVGILEATTGSMEAAIVALMICGFFDMFDGTIAKTKKNRTEFEKNYGVQLDSLSDVVCFGVLPTIIAFVLLKDFTVLRYFSILYLIAAISRLTYFNVEEEIRRKEETTDRKFYTGLPVTPSALIIPVLYLSKFVFPTIFPYIFLGGLLIVAVLQVSKLRLPHLSLKGLLFVAGLGILLLIGILWLCLK